MRNSKKVYHFTLRTGTYYIKVPTYKQTGAASRFALVQFDHCTSLHITNRSYILYITNRNGSPEGASNRSSAAFRFATVQFEKVNNFFKI